MDFPEYLSSLPGIPECEEDLKEEIMNDFPRQETESGQYSLEDLEDGGLQEHETGRRSTATSEPKKPT